MDESFKPTIKLDKRRELIAQRKIGGNEFTDAGTPGVLVDDTAYLVDDTVALAGGEKVASAPIFIK